VHPLKKITGHLPAHLLVRRGIPLLPDDRKKDCFFCTLFQDISKKELLLFSRISTVIFGSMAWNIRCEGYKGIPKKNIPR
jgi:hypothetical protein